MVRAAKYGFPLVVAIIGGDPPRFTPFVDLYHRASSEFGQPGAADRGALARAISRRPMSRRSRKRGRTRAMMNRIGRERGWPPMTREQFERTAGPNGALMVGSPETVRDKIAGDRSTGSGCRAST